MTAPPDAVLAAVTTVLAHHLNGALALAFAAPPILVVAGVVFWLRRHGPAEDEDFDWDDELAGTTPAGPPSAAGQSTSSTGGS